VISAIIIYFITIQSATGACGGVQVEWYTRLNEVDYARTQGDMWENSYTGLHEGVQMELTKLIVTQSC